MKQTQRKYVEKERLIFWLIYSVLALGILTTGWFFYRGQSANIRSQVERQLTAIADLKVNQLVEWREERMLDASVFHRNIPFTTLAQNLINNPQDKVFLARLESWLSPIQASQQYERVFLNDASGVERFSIPPTPQPLSAAIQEHIHLALQTGQMEFVDFHRNEFDQKIYLAVVIPIFDEATQNAVGTLVFQIDPEIYLYPFIQRWPAPSQSAETLLVRHDGSDALYLTQLRFNKDSALNLRIPLDQESNPSVMAVLGGTGVVEGLDYRGVPVVASIGAIPGTDWYLVARQDISEVYAPLTSSLGYMIALVVVLLFGTGAALGFVWRQRNVRHYQEQLHTSEMLHKSEEKFAIAFQSSPYAIIITRLSDGTIIEVNEGCIHLTGFTRSEMIGKTTLALNLWLNSEERGKATAELAKNSKTDGMELHFRRKNGEEFTGWFSAGLIVLDDEKCVLSIINDITERKNVEEALRASEVRFRSLFESMTDGALLHEMIYDANHVAVDYCILDGNPAFEEHTGIPLATLRNRPASQAYGTGKPPYLEEYARVADTGQSYAFETYFAPMHRHFFIKAFSPARGQFATLFSDITERIQHEEELKRKNEELERFTYTISHDLKSPLVTIKTFMGYLEEDMISANTQSCQQDIFYIHNAADKIGQLLDELLEMSRIGRVINPPVKVGFQQLIQDVLNIAAGQIAERGAAVQVSPSNIDLVGDRPRLVEIWQNLVENAVKFMGDQPDPLIEIGFEQRQEETVFFVRDNGIGIDPRYHTKVFSLFEKLDTRSGGTGIGLALVKRIIELYNGRVWVESEGTGKGCCFCFTLPGALEIA